MVISEILGASGVRRVGWGALLGLLSLASACGGNTKKAGDEPPGSGGKSGNEGGKSSSAGANDASAGDAPGGGSGTLAGGRPSFGGASPMAGSGALGQGGAIPAQGGTGALGQGGTGASAGTADSRYLQRVRYDQSDKVDVLFVIDNSISMGEKQELLLASMPRFVERLINPLCIGDSGNPTGEYSSNGLCPEGLPEFTPLRDLHLGVITSSLGDMGSGDTCTPGQEEKDDKAWLLGSLREGLESWDGLGFLAWDPDQREVPAGTADADELLASFSDHVSAVGDVGCGYEASLEAWYRFLIDPEPPETVTRDASSSLTVAGPPSRTLLAQRSAFLRPDSIVAIVMLTDENDCSIIDYGQGWLVGLQSGGTFTMPRATQACAADPNSPCCFSCSIPDNAVPSNCTQPSSDAECMKGAASMIEDHPNLRCFQQKRRFGFDLLQPTSRYVQGLTQLEILTRTGDSNGDGVIDTGDRIRNPLFASPTIVSPRDRSMVFLAGILGVPWQDVADASLETTDLRYLRYDELVAQGRWDWILGSPYPADGLMYETHFDRTTLSGVPQQHPAGMAVGGELQSATTTTQLGNPINGHESNISDGSDLQAACIFALGEQIDCENEPGSCDCGPDDAAYNYATCNGTTQTHGRAFPGTRQLEVLRSFGEATGNSVVASICAKHVTTSDPLTDANYAYTPALDALVDRMKEAFSSECLAQPLGVETDGSVACALLEVSIRDRDCQPCSQLAGRIESSFDPDFVSERIGVEACLCEIQEYEGAALDACRTELAEPSEPGFCYVDGAPRPNEDPDSDEVRARQALVADCPGNARRKLRLGPEIPAESTEATLFWGCPGD